MEPSHEYRALPTPNPAFVTHSRLQDPSSNDIFTEVTKKGGSTRRKNDLQNRFGSVIRDYRKRLGISQEELGFRAGLHRTYITDIERGVRNISLKSVASLSKALEISTWHLFANTAAIGEGGSGTKVRPNRTGLGEVLMIEDNPIDAELALRAFKRARFANPVLVARDGEAAIEFLSEAAAPVESGRFLTSCSLTSICPRCPESRCFA